MIALKQHLRQGNIVQNWDGQLVTIKNPGFLFCSCFESNALYSAFGLSPIKITYNIMICVFDFQIHFEPGYEEYWIFTKNDLMIIHDEVIGSIVLQNGIIIKCIEYVHELQNLLAELAFNDESAELKIKLRICQNL